MGISSVTNRVSYVGDGSSATFAFPYEFFAPLDLNVFIYNSSTQQATQQVLNTNYTLGGTPNSQGVYTQGGSVIFTSSIPQSLYVVIARDPSRVQNYALLQNGAINSLALVQEFDYTTLLIQRLHDKAIRSLRFPDGYAGTLDIQVPAGTAAGKYMQIDSSGLRFEWVYPSLYFGPIGYPLVGNGSSTPATFQALSLVGSGVSGVLAGQNGGTGFGGPWQQYAAVYADTTGSLNYVPNAGAGLVLTTNASSAPSWQSPQVAQSGILPVVNGGTGVGTLPTGTLLVMSSALQMTGLALGLTDQVLIGATGGLPTWGRVNLASGSSVVSVLGIVNGGTGQSSQAPAFNALSPNTTMGDLSWFNGSSNVRLPVGANGQVATISGSSIVWQNSQTPTFNQVRPGSSTYNVLLTDNVILVQSGCSQVVLFNALGNSGKQVTIFKDFSGFDPVTITGNSCPVDGSSVTLVMNFESKTCYCDGNQNNWKVIDSKVPYGWTSYTPSVVGAGSTSVSAFAWRRVGDSIEVNGGFTAGTLQAVLFSISLPVGLNIDAFKALINNTTANPGQKWGFIQTNANSALGAVVTAPATNTTLVYIGLAVNQATAFTPQNGNAAGIPLVSAALTRVEFKVPIMNFT